MSHRMTFYLLSGQFCLHAANCHIRSCVGAAFNHRQYTPDQGLSAQAQSYAHLSILFWTA